LAKTANASCLAHREDSSPVSGLAPAALTRDLPRSTSRITQDLTSAIQFRLYLFDDANGTAAKPGGAHVDDVRLFGKVRPIELTELLVNPEPGSVIVWSLLGIAGVAIGCARKRRRAA